MHSIKVIVHEDGDTELTKVFVKSIMDRALLACEGAVLFSEEEVTEDKLMAELKDYGHEEGRAQEAITFITTAKVGESCIV